MRKIFPLTQEGLHRDRVLDAVKHDIRKYIKRERSRELPAGVDFVDFSCRVGASKETASSVHLSAIMEKLDAVANEGGLEVYVEILAKSGFRQARDAGGRSK